jgi:integrase
METEALKPKISRPRGTGSVFKRGRFWWVAYSNRGRQHAESSHSMKKADAERLLKTRLSEITTGSYLTPDRRKTLVTIELSESAKSGPVKSLRELLRTDHQNNARRTAEAVDASWELHIHPFFVGWRASDVSGEVVSRYVNQRITEGAKPATINRELSALYRAFRLGREQGLVRELPLIKRLREDNRRVGFLADGEHLKLIDGSPLWFRACVELGRTYAWRAGEVLALKVRSVDILNRSISLDVGSTKNGEGREVPLSDALYPLIRELCVGKKPDDALITRGKKPVRSIRHAWQSACVRAGLGVLSCRECGTTISGKPLHCPNCKKNRQLNESSYEGLLFHDLRRTGARNLRRSGVAEEVAMKVGGWRTPSVFKRYSIVGGDDIREAIRKVQERERLVLLQINDNRPEAAPVADRPILN